MPRTLQGALTRIARNVSDLKDSNHHDGLQRRNQVVDLYGYEFYRQGSTDAPAQIGISISQDLGYFERFEFKIIVSPFIIPISSGGTEPVTLDISGDTENSTVPPNTHKHGSGSIVVSPNPHNHTVTAGITMSTSTFSDFRVLIEDIDITAELKQQYGGDWIEGEGIYPRNDLSNYDILKVVGYLTNEQREKILSPGYKKIELRANGFYNCTLVNYLKFSHTNR